MNATQKRQGSNYSNGMENGCSTGFPNDDTKLKTIRNKEANGNHTSEENGNVKNGKLSDEERYPNNEIAEIKEVGHIALISSPKEGLKELPKILQIAESCHGSIKHLETRLSEKNGVPFDIFVQIEAPKEKLHNIINALRANNINDVNILRDQKINIKDTWFPKHISELDFCTRTRAEFQPDLDPDHPGSCDKTFLERRKEIAQISFNYKYGDIIPKVQYTKEEIEVWGTVFNELKSLLKTHACKEYVEVFEMLEKECGYREDNIPQLEDVSRFLKKRTGFQLRPAAGFLSARDFLASLAFRVFQSTQYVRHASCPDHSPDPDCFHELLGHVPMLADPTFANFSQEIGLASLGATDEEIEKIATLYWFTVEMGLCVQDGEKKVYGAALLSSFGELKYALSDKPQHLQFDPKQTAIQPYRAQDYQRVYFVAQSFDDAKEKFRKYVTQNLSRRYDVHYDPFTQSVQIIDTPQKLKTIADNLQYEAFRMSNAISRIAAH